MTTRTGTIVEFKAMLWLWELGYEVYYNPCHTGFADLLAVDQQGSILRIDVKMICYNQKGSRLYAPISEKQKELGVIGLYYDRYKDLFLWEYELPVKRRQCGQN